MYSLLPRPLLCKYIKGGGVGARELAYLVLEEEITVTARTGSSIGCVHSGFSFSSSNTLSMSFKTSSMCLLPIWDLLSHTLLHNFCSVIRYGGESCVNLSPFFLPLLARLAGAVRVLGLPDPRDRSRDDLVGRPDVGDSLHHRRHWALKALD